jgi:catechol 2,3-dioxygenase
MSDNKFNISDAARIGYVSITTANLDKLLAFYREVIGLNLNWRGESSAGIGTAGKDIIRLVENRNAARYRNTTGLYHLAILLPDRKELARIIGRLFELNYTNYPTDHTISQSTYLSDPEGNGIELYADTPWEGSLQGLSALDKYGNPRSGTEPLDLENLFNELKPGDNLYLPLPGDTRAGHIHLHVNNLNAAMEFYTGVLGFEKFSISLRQGFADVGTPGYNVHMVAFNTWKGENIQPPPQDSLGLRYFSISLPGNNEMESLLSNIKRAGLEPVQSDEGYLIRDPAGNGVQLQVVSS